MYEVLNVWDSYCMLQKLCMRIKIKTFYDRKNVRKNEDRKGKVSWIACKNKYAYLWFSWINVIEEK